jgi:hypothetical protein
LLEDATRSHSLPLVCEMLLSCEQDVASHVLLI